MTLHLLFCPGYHARSLSDTFLADLDLPREITCHCYPATDLPPYSSYHLLNFLEGRIARHQPLFVMGFSAGVVGAIAVAKQWHQQGGQIEGLVAIDGWGVPLFAPFPCYRLSPDHLSHITTRWLGTGQINFYADPSVSHLDLMRSPQTRYGWCTDQENKPAQYKTVATFLWEILIGGQQETVRGWGLLTTIGDNVAMLGRSP